MLKNGSFIVLGVRLFVLTALLLIGGTAKAADSSSTTTTMPDCTASFPLCAPTDCACINNQMQCAELARAQRKMDFMQKFLDTAPKIDLALYACVDKIDKLLSAATDTSITGALLDSLVESFIGQACSAATSVYSQVKGFTMSQVNRICIPSISGGLGTLNLGLTPASCDGMSLVSFSPVPSAEGTVNSPGTISSWFKGK